MKQPVTDFNLDMFKCSGTYQDCIAFRSQSKLGPTTSTGGIKQKSRQTGDLPERLFFQCANYQSYGSAYGRDFFTNASASSYCSAREQLVLLQLPIYLCLPPSRLPISRLCHATVHSSLSLISLASRASRKSSDWIRRIIAKSSYAHICRLCRKSRKWSNGS